MTTNTKHKGRGRTKGSFSFALATMADLKAKFPDATSVVQVSRKWAEKAGLPCRIMGPSTSCVAPGAAPSMVVTATDLND